MHFTFWLLRVTRCGTSWVVALPRGLRESLNLQPGDYIAIRVHAPFATFRRVQLGDIAPDAPTDVAALPPAKIERGGHAH